jgi:hypothetical protein
MPRGDRSSFTDKQKRQAELIEEGYEERGGGRKEGRRDAQAQRNATVKSGARKAARKR